MPWLGRGPSEGAPACPGGPASQPCAAPRHRRRIVALGERAGRARACGAVDDRDGRRGLLRADDQIAFEMPDLPSATGEPRLRPPTGLAATSGPDVPRETARTRRSSAGPRTARRRAAHPGGCRWSTGVTARRQPLRRARRWSRRGGRDVPQLEERDQRGARVLTAPVHLRTSGPTALALLASASVPRSARDARGGDAPRTVPSLSSARCRTTLVGREMARRVEGMPARRSHL